MIHPCARVEIRPSEDTRCRYLLSNSYITCVIMLIYTTPLVAPVCQVFKANDIIFQPFALRSMRWAYLIALTPLSRSPTSPMSKREGGTTQRGNPTVKKRKGVKIRTVFIPDSDEEGHPSNINTTDYARLVRTQVKPSGKVGNVTTSSIPLLEAEDVTNDVLPEVDTNHSEVAVVEDVEAANPPTRRRRKKANDSVSLALMQPLLYLTNSLSDQDAFLA